MATFYKLPFNHQEPCALLAFNTNDEVQCLKKLQLFYSDGLIADISVSDAVQYQLKPILPPNTILSIIGSSSWNNPMLPQNPYLNEIAGNKIHGSVFLGVCMQGDEMDFVTFDEAFGKKLLLAIIA